MSRFEAATAYAATLQNATTSQKASLYGLFKQANKASGAYRVRKRRPMTHTPLEATADIMPICDIFRATARGRALAFLTPSAA